MSNTTLHDGLADNHPHRPTSALQLEDDVLAKLRSGEVTETALHTDNRVLARITDGIYRSPTSAIRELVANAFDADATNVIIEMNPPWFDRITIRDDGEGMDAKSLARVIWHIGGSSKRTKDGVRYGTTGDNPLYSKGGRRLIGRIGIGLFSVAQLTRHFQIITKRRGTDYRLVADVILHTYNEDGLAAHEENEGESSTTGKVLIQSFAADDLDSHGTDIVLLDLKRDALDLLTSREDWAAANHEPYKYHIGTALEVSALKYAIDKVPAVPWTESDSPLERFQALHAAVAKESGTENIKLEVVLDRYLQLIWKLALAVPLNYLDGIHPFDLTADTLPRLYLLSNEKAGGANEILLRPNERVRDRLHLVAPEHGKQPFRVFVDGIELRRPVRLGSTHDSARPTDRPILFFGSWAPDLAAFPATASGGSELAFEGYFLWMPKVVPREHQGLLVRIADASGILYDKSFMEYPIAELNRLAQTTAEIFVSRGLDAALNIDRESFNFGHPHAKLVRRWVHNAIRQLATTQKRIADEARVGKREAVLSKDLRDLDIVVVEKLRELGVSERPEVQLVAAAKGTAAVDRVNEERSRGTLAFESERVFGGVKRPGSSRSANTEKARRDAQLRAIASLLEAAGAFKEIDYRRQQDLLNGIARIVWGSK